MNKKIIVIVGALVALIGIGSYFASKTIEGQVEEFIRNEIAKTPVKVENVAYSASSGTLILTNISYTEKLENIDILLNAHSATIEGFNDAILDAETTDFHVFDDLYLDKLSYIVKLDGTQFSETKADTIHVKNYKQDLRKLWIEWQKDKTSEAFYTAMFTQAFDSIVVKKYELIANPTLLEGFAGMTAEELVFDAVDFMDWTNHPYGQGSSSHYNDIKIISADVEIEMDTVLVKDFLIPHPKFYADLNSFYFDSLETEKTAAMEDILKLLEGYALGEKPVVENITFEGTKILLKKDAPQNIKDSAIRIGKVAIDIEAGDTLSLSFLLDKLSLSAEYIYPEIDPTYVPLVRAFMGDMISFDFYTKHALNFTNNEYYIKTKSSVAQMASASVEGTGIAELAGSKADKIAYLLNQIDGLKFKNITLSYEDLGLIPFIGQVAVKETRLPLEALLPVATAEIQNFIKDIDAQIEAKKVQLEVATSDKTSESTEFDESSVQDQSASLTENIIRQERLYTAVKQIGEMTLKMLEKPGAFTAKLVFSEPITASDAADQILSLIFMGNAHRKYADIDFSLDVQQGEKTFLEATPQELLKK